MTILGSGPIPTFRNRLDEGDGRAGLGPQVDLSSLHRSFARDFDGAEPPITIFNFDRSTSLLFGAESSICRMVGTQC